jgi:Uncharacterised nucleotidyltransferase
VSMAGSGRASTGKPHGDSPRVDAARLFLTGLLSSGGPRETCLKHAQSLGGAWLREQGLDGLMWHTWRDEFEPDPPAGLAALCAGHYTDVARAEVQRRELKIVLETLAAQGVVPILFKGAALAHTVYPNPACRAMGDLDLWVAATEMPKAHAALERLGYVESSKPTRPLALQKLMRNEVPMIGTRPGLGLVELHWSAFGGEWLRQVTRVDLAGIRGRSMLVRVAEQPARVMSPEDSLVQLAAHMAVNHNMASPWLRTLADLTLLVRKQGMDWDVVVERARAWRLATATWRVLSLGADLAGLEEAKPAVVQLAPSTMRRWWLNRIANATSLVEMRDMARGPFRLVYLLLLADRTRDALRLMARALWPDRDWLEARYGRSNLAVQLRHLVSAAQGKP